MKIELDLPFVVPNNISKYQNIWSKLTEVRERKPKTGRTVKGKTYYPRLCKNVVCWLATDTTVQNPGPPLVIKECYCRCHVRLFSLQNYKPFVKKTSAMFILNKYLIPNPKVSLYINDIQLPMLFLPPDVDLTSTFWTAKRMFSFTRFYISQRNHICRRSFNLKEGTVGRYQRYLPTLWYIWPNLTFGRFTFWQ